MKVKTLRNNADKDIIDYRIEEIEFDANGEVILNSEGLPRKTGRTLEWSIKSGETLEFPEYVADYLLSIFGKEDPTRKDVFLEQVSFSDSTESKEEPKIGLSGTPEAKPTTGSVTCKTCGMHFKNIRGLALHIASKHSDKLL